MARYMNPDAMTSRTLTSSGRCGGDHGFNELLLRQGTTDRKNMVAPHLTIRKNTMWTKEAMDQVFDMYRFQEFQMGSCDLWEKHHLPFLQEAVGDSARVRKREAVINRGDRLGVLDLCDDVAREADESGVPVAVRMVFNRNPITGRNGHAMGLVAVPRDRTVYVLDPAGPMGFVATGGRWVARKVRSPWSVAVHHSSGWQGVQAELRAAAISSDGYLDPSSTGVCQWLSTAGMLATLLRGGSGSDVVEMQLPRVLRSMYAFSVENEKRICPRWWRYDRPGAVDDDDEDDHIWV